MKEIEYEKIKKDFKYFMSIYDTCDILGEGKLKYCLLESEMEILPETTYVHWLLKLVHLFMFNKDSTIGLYFNSTKDYEMVKGDIFTVVTSISKRYWLDTEILKSDLVSYDLSLGQVLRCNGNTLVIFKECPIVAKKLQMPFSLDELYIYGKEKAIYHDLSLASSESAIGSGTIWIRPVVEPKVRMEIALI